MKSLYILLIWCVGVSVSVFAQTDTSKADADYRAFQKLTEEPIPGSRKVIGAERYFTWIDAHRREVAAAALAFEAAHPADPRRWELLLSSVKQPPLFIKSFGPDVETKGWSAVIADKMALGEWNQRAEAVTRALLAADDVPNTVRESAEWSAFAKDFRTSMTQRTRGQPYEAGSFTDRFKAHVNRYAQLDILSDRAVDYLGTLEKLAPASVEVIWRDMLTAPNNALRATAADRVKLFELMRKPLNLSFTAVDGRVVDLKSLRGKVVLVDFWATWCGPCIAELPHVLEAYAKYHDQGFEIIGITLENAGLNSKDTPEINEAKLMKAKKVLADFTTENRMPWPQYFDGKWWKNEIALEYFINSIPATFLLDQEGNIAAVNLRGQKLDAEIKRLLKL